MTNNNNVPGRLQKVLAAKNNNTSPSSLFQPQEQSHEVKQRVSLIERFEETFRALGVPHVPTNLEALERMTVLMIDTYEYLQLLNNEDVSKSDPHFLKELENNIAEVNAYLKAHRKDVLDRESN
jgi:hypothetical protein